mmetsp:Transcript_84495/g.261454  ORF Transcript_84495/g.261454 Transcript_84495/m.261454 type:complete len:220 (+) Transcript_84495:137-796(+)
MAKMILKMENSTLRRLLAFAEPRCCQSTVSGSMSCSMPLALTGCLPRKRVQGPPRRKRSRARSRSCMELKTTQMCSVDWISASTPSTSSCISWCSPSEEPGRKNASSVDSFAITSCLKCPKRVSKPACSEGSAFSACTFLKKLLARRRSAARMLSLDWERCLKSISRRIRFITSSSQSSKSQQTETPTGSQLQACLTNSSRSSSTVSPASSGKPARKSA